MVGLSLIFVSGLEKKGLQVQMVDDAIALGVHQAALNVQLCDFLNESLEIRDPNFRGLAAQIDPLSRSGAKIYIIFLNRKTGNPTLDRVLLHPKYDERAPNRLSAFNVVAPTGLDTIRRVCSAIQRRFEKQITGWIVGNEVNSHWEWANQGAATASEVADTTERSLRVVHEATGKPVYLSLEHHWTMRGASPERSATGREILETVARLARERGDFEWRLAYHPYPENLFEPRFWNDKVPTLQFDTPKITFKNLEVITEFMKRKELRWHGRPRPVNLSEQGFHRPNSPDGEIVQAAAYAYAFKRVAMNPGIEAFILNRHVDNRGEGGLLLGLWTNVPGSVGDPDRRTRMWSVFQACGTPREDAETAFALPMVGLKSWKESAPQPIEH